MNNVIYLDEPGILYDMLFALKLRFNGERTYLPLRKNVLNYEDDEKIYNSIIRKLAHVPEKLLPLFYYDNDHNVKTAIFTYLNDYIDLTTDGLIEYFYESLRDINRLKKTVYTNYISKNCPDVFDLTTFQCVKEEIFSSALPSDLKMYLINFLLFDEEELESIISVLRKVETICREYHQSYQKDIIKYTEKFNIEQVLQLHENHSFNIADFSTICVSFCVILRYTIFYNLYYNYNRCLSVLGINAAKNIFTENFNLSVNLYKLGNILNDEQRLKILDMLTQEDMYCAQIASKLGLKNNSTLYHLVMMEKEGLIASHKKTIDSRRIYYNINRNYINAIKKLINTKFHGMD